MAKYDDLIEEASGELEGVEGEVHSATQQLLDLQGRVSQLAHHTQAAEKTLHKVCPAYSPKPFFCVQLAHHIQAAENTCRRCTLPSLSSLSFCVQLHVLDVGCWINPYGCQPAGTPHPSCWEDPAEGPACLHFQTLPLRAAVWA